MSLQPMPPYPWQQSLWENFVSWVEQERLAHALLIAGPEGLGGLALARAMAQYLLCNAATGPLACGKCRSCQLIDSETHPDLFAVQPEAPSTAIKIDQIRQLSGFIGKTAQQGGRKVVIIAPAEAMNINAANALLKNLEEPAGRTHMLVVSPEPSRLLATIRSRCAKLVLTAPQGDEALHWLTQAGVTDAEQLLMHAGGEPLKVQRWFEQDFSAQQDRMRKDLEELASGQRSPLAVAKAWLDFRSVEAVDCLLIWVQQAIKHHQVGQGAIGRVAEVHSFNRWLAGVPVQLLFRYWDKLTHTKKELLSTNNPNPELLLDELLIGWAALCRQGRSPRASVS